MGKLLVDVDREALERVRIRLGARSHAETIRKLICEADPEWSASDVAAVRARGPAPTLAINRIAPAPPAKAFRPHPKPGKGKQ